MSCNTVLRQNGFKLTPQRKLIAGLFHESSGHLTAREIISVVEARMPGVNKSTIYRTLDLLENLDCVVKSESGDGPIYHHAEEGHHHHIVCTRCGQTEECLEDLFRPVRRALVQKYSFKADFRHVVITGLCRKCAAESG